MKLFPLNTGVSQIRGIIEIMKDNKNSIDVSKLAEATNEEIDDLFPLIDTCVLLKLCTVKGGAVNLTKSGKILATHNTRDLFSKALVKVEPFKTTVLLLKKGKELSTQELSRALYKKGIFYNTDEITNMELLKNLLLKWGVSTKLFTFNNNSDMWAT